MRDMANFMDSLTKALVEKGLVKGVIRVDHSEYTFAAGKWEISLEAMEKQGRSALDSTREFQELIIEPVKKPESEFKNPADAFINDYFRNQEVRKTGKGLWIAAIVMVIAVSAFFIIMKTGRTEKNILQNGSKTEVSLAYSKLFREAADYFAGNQLNSAWQKAELAEKISPTTEIADLKNKIKKKQAETAAAAKALADEEKKKQGEYAANERNLKNYLDTCNKFIKQGDYTQACENFTRAKQIRNSPEVVAMEIQLKTMQAGIAEQKKKDQKKLDDEAAAAKALADAEKKKQGEYAAKEMLLKNYLDTCNNLLRQGDFAQAFENFTKAKQIRNSPEVVAMENRLKIIRAEIEKQKMLTQTSYLDACKKFLQQGDFDLAGKNLAQAKQIRNSPEVAALEKQLKARLAENEKQKQIQNKAVNKAAPAPGNAVAAADAAKPAVEALTLAGKISDLNYALAANYSALILRINLSNMTESISVSGSVTITMRIDDKGRAWVQAVNDTGLTTEPESYREKIRKAIKLSLEKLVFPEPKDKAGNRITVENWRVNFKVGQYSGQLIITRQY